MKREPRWTWTLTRSRAYVLAEFLRYVRHIAVWWFVTIAAMAIAMPIAWSMGVSLVVIRAYSEAALAAWVPYSVTAFVLAYCLRQTREEERGLRRDEYGDQWWCAWWGEANE